LQRRRRRKWPRRDKQARVSGVGARQKPHARNSDATITEAQVAQRGGTHAQHSRRGISHSKTQDKR
jgi:hypothetical protein